MAGGEFHVVPGAQGWAGENHWTESPVPRRDQCHLLDERHSATDRGSEPSDPLILGTGRLGIVEQQKRGRCLAKISCCKPLPGFLWEKSPVIPLYFNDEYEVFETLIQMRSKKFMPLLGRRVRLDQPSRIKMMPPYFGLLDGLVKRRVVPKWVVQIVCDQENHFRNLLSSYSY